MLFDLGISRCGLVALVALLSLAATFGNAGGPTTPEQCVGACTGHVGRALTTTSPNLYTLRSLSSRPRDSSRATSAELPPAKRGGCVGKMGKCTGGGGGGALPSPSTSVSSGNNPFRNPSGASSADLTSTPVHHRLSLPHNQQYSPLSSAHTDYNWTPPAFRLTAKEKGQAAGHSQSLSPSPAASPKIQTSRVQSQSAPVTPSRPSVGRVPSFHSTPGRRHIHDHH